MSKPSYMDELRDAYYDLYDFAEPLALSGNFPGTFNTMSALEKFYELSDKLEDDGYTEEEIDYLSYIAIADAITDSHHGELLRKYYDNDEET